MIKADPRKGSAENVDMNGALLKKIWGSRRGKMSINLRHNV